MDERTEREVTDGLRAGSTDAWHRLYDAFAVRTWQGVSRLLGGDGPWRCRAKAGGAWRARPRRAKP